MLEVEKFIKSLDRNAVSTNIDEKRQDLEKYSKKIIEFEFDDNGQHNPKYNMILLDISTVPKTLQRKGGQTESIHRYKNYLRSDFEKHSKALSRLKNKPVILHIIMYLDKKDYNSAIQHLDKAISLNPDLSKDIDINIKNFKDTINNLEQNLKSKFDNR